MEHTYIHSTNNNLHILQDILTAKSAKDISVLIGTVVPDNIK